MGTSSRRMELLLSLMEWRWMGQDPGPSWGQGRLEVTFRHPGGTCRDRSWRDLYMWESSVTNMLFKAQGASVRGEDLG